MPAFIYLHGFQSGPLGAKAAYLAQRCEETGWTMHRPDLNTPDFEHMTISTIVAKAAETMRTCPEDSIVLIGSSLGGYAALQLLDCHPELAARISHLVLLAPAVGFPDYFVARFKQQAGEAELNRWREDRHTMFPHHAYEMECPLGYGFVEDLPQWSSGFDVVLPMPVLILHSKQDELVSYERSVRLAAGRDNVQLHLFEDSDHGLQDKYPDIWRLMMSFIESGQS